MFSALASAQEASPLPEDAAQQALAACQVLSGIENGRIDLPEKLRTPLQDKVARRRLYLASFLDPLRGLTYTEKKKVLPLVDTVIRDSIKVLWLRSGHSLLCADFCARNISFQETIGLSSNIFTRRTISCL